MTDIFLAGAENPQHLALLTSCAAAKVAVNVGSLLRRAGFSTWELDLPYPDWEWIAYTDGPVAQNDLELALDKAAKPPLFVVGSDLWDTHPLYLPLINNDGQANLVDTSKGLFITDGVFQSPSSLRSVLALRRPGMDMGVITGSIERSISRFDYVISSGWYSTMAYGETQVWDGQKMNRYNSKRKADARKKHYSDIQNLGMDPALVAADDPDEVARVAIASWQAYGSSLAGGVVPVTNQGNGTGAGSGTGVAPVAGTTPVMRQQVTIPGLAHDSVFVTHTDLEGQQTSEEVPLVRSSAGMIRSCNNCHLATAGCPGYTPNAICTYEIPVQIRTKEQMQAAMEAVIEIQIQRVLQARFSEEIQGQELTPATGREIERLYKIMEKMTAILDDRDSVKLSIKSKAESGVISRLFGTQTGQNARQLATPLDSNDIVDATVIDA